MHLFLINVQAVKRDYHMTDAEYQEFRQKIAEEDEAKLSAQKKIDKKLQKRAQKKELKASVKDSCKTQ